MVDRSMNKFSIKEIVCVAVCVCVSIFLYEWLKLTDSHMCSRRHTVLRVYFSVVSPFTLGDAP